MVMRLPTIAGVIDRRILANWRCDPAVVAKLLPAPFRPKLAGGHAVAGVCLIRLRQIRPAVLPALFGVSSENAAHRIAVEWTDEAGRPREGVYILRRDTSSALNALAGGRLFPGVHHAARFDVDESADRFSVGVHSDDGNVGVEIVARRSAGWPPGSVFGTLDEASAFFAGGSLGYSPARAAGHLDALELATDEWSVEALAVKSARSSLFDDPAQFPLGSAAFDCALLMHDVRHWWHSRPGIDVAVASGGGAAAGV
jgi:hypothetical protein